MMTSRAMLAGALGLAARRAAAAPTGPPLVGALSIGLAPERSFLWRQFVENMLLLGYSEGKTVRYAVRFTTDPTRLPALAQEILAQSPRVVFANGDEPARAAAAQSATVPIVAHTDDHIAAGLTDSYARPSRNVTGVSRQEGELDTKRLELLHEMVPKARLILTLRDPQTVGSARTAALVVAATRLGLALDLRDIRGSSDVEDAVAAGVAGGGHAMLVLGSPLLASPDVELRIRTAAMPHRLPVMVQNVRDAAKGNLAAYGPDQAAIVRRLAYMVDRILKGASPADLPIEQPDRFGLAINMQIARTLSLDIPTSLLARADEVIE